MTDSPTDNIPGPSRWERAGKGTQAVRLSEHFGCGDVSTGDIFRDNVANGTELGLAAKEYMDAGDLVPDEVVIQMVTERLAELVGVGFSLVSTGAVRDETILVNESVLSRWFPALRSALPAH